MAERKSRAGSSSKAVMCFLIFGAITLGTLLWDWLVPEAQTSAIEIAASEESIATTSARETSGDLIPIYLVGAVERPGIYEVKRGSYLYQLVQTAGGLTDGAAQDRINLALRLDENQLIRIPTREEAAAGLAEGLMIPDSTPSSKLVDINQADLAELDGLPGIGPSTARAIIEYRDSKGHFKQIEDLTKVPGIKDSRFQTLKDLICVRNLSS